MNESPPWDLRLLQLPLRSPHAAAHGTLSTRQLVLISRDTDQGLVFGECAALNQPSYTAEYARGAYEMLRTELLPRVARLPMSTPTEAMVATLNSVCGHPMAKAAVEMAWLEAELRRSQVAGAERLGARARTVSTTAVLGVDETTREVALAKVDAGWRSLKFKTSPNSVMRVAVLLEELRRLHGSAVNLAVDANGSFSWDQRSLLKELRHYELAYIEQPFGRHDLLAHAAFRQETGMRVCLDESIESLEQAATAIALGAADAMNLKPSRVGGLLAAASIAELCAESSVDAFCGGMLESGIGRAAAVAFAAVPAMDLPTDLGPNAEYYAEDLANPLTWEQGSLGVPNIPGFGAEVDEQTIDRFTVTRCWV